MKKLKIIAHKITNLTDARYFAAKGVDWMGFLIHEKEQLASIKQIMQWIEGPQILVQYQDKALFDDWWLEYIDGIWTNDMTSILAGKICFSSEVSLNPDYLIIDAPENLHSYSGIRILNLDLPDIDYVQKIINHDLDGVILSGTPEEKTGYKSYDSYDQIFDYLEQLNLI